MSKEKIQTASAPAAIGPYSQAIRCDQFIFCSGQIPLNPKTQEMVSGNIAEQVDQVLKNLEAVLQGSGSSLQDVVRTTIYLQDLNDFTVVNQIYGKYFSEPYPARVTIQAAALPKGAKVEIDAIAKVPN